MKFQLQYYALLFLLLFILFIFFFVLRWSNKSILIINQEETFKQISSMELENVDRISSLHESIRRHILSFLSMEDAIKTSVLSKNWRHVCSSLPNLEFHEDSYGIKKSTLGYVDDFKDVVDQILIGHNESHITSFSLYLWMEKQSLSTSHLNSWINFAIRHNVQQLTLVSVFWQIKRISSCLFSYNTLTHMRLVNVHLKLPTTIKLPFLKCLVLSRIEFVNDNLSSMLFSSCCCPVLEQLQLFNCYQNHANTNVFSFSNLKLLKLQNNSKVPVKVLISRLHKFIYVGKEPPNLSTETLSSLSNTCFGLTLPPTNSNNTDPDYFDNSASKILAGLRNVEALNLRDFYLEFLTRDRDLSASLATPCYSLKSLKLCMHDTENQVCAITLLLRSYPNLQDLSISLNQDCTSLNMLNMEEYWQSTLLSTKDILKHLKTFDVELFQVSTNALDIMRYVLASARALEEMRVKVLEPLVNVEKDRMKLSEKLLTFPRASIRSAIYLCD
ncbi:hypothetical protein AQUCO_00500246v1 [Aquilegia coerulea]|uniref:FBD domain-containing protein n=1 Tax=Aquilegia coerulea TaxID=218851 RepID=A0A2G5ER19_AQUCA|nr:hypothetical protein AQUCO_00500246v1 [Aquilegia coerulea]